jgi:hypothetical protein
MLGDANLVSGKTADWEEDQGIEHDDDEALAVENGEFVKIPSKVKPITKRTAPTGPLKSAAAAPSSKRARTATTASTASKRSLSSVSSG